MLFVRSLNGGVSHSPEELTSEDLERRRRLAVDVLDRYACLAAASRLALGEDDLLRALPEQAPTELGRCSLPSTIVAKWLPASAPALLANAT